MNINLIDLLVLILVGFVCVVPFIMASLRRLLEMLGMILLIALISMLVVTLIVYAEPYVRAMKSLDQSAGGYTALFFETVHNSIFYDVLDVFGFTSISVGGLEQKITSYKSWLPTVSWLFNMTGIKDAL